MKIFFVIVVWGLGWLGANLDAKKNLKIYTSFYPWEFFVREIVGDRGKIINLAGNRDVHEYFITPREMIDLQKADLIVYWGESLEPWVKQIVFQLRDQSTLFPLSKKMGIRRDPHVWLDLGLVPKIIELIKDRLVALAPFYEEEFIERSSQLKQQIQNLDRQFAIQLKNCSQREVLVSHNAFTYLALRYQFVTHSITGRFSHHDASVSRLVELNRLVRQKKLKYLLSDPKVENFNQAVVDQHQLKVLPFYSLEVSVSNENFLEVMKKNLFHLSQAMECES